MQVGRWGDLPKRVASAAVLVPLAIFCLGQGGWPWRLLIGAMALGLAVEWTALCGRRWISPAGLALSVCVLAVWIMAMQGNAGPALAFTLIGVPVVWRTGYKTPRALSLALGLPYIGCATLALIWLRAIPGSGFHWVLLVLLVVWASDIGAYIAGRAIGGRKLAPAISPGKTRSGAAGGLAASCLVGVGFAMWQPGFGDPWALVGLTAVLSVVSQAGDLLESFAKRRFGVKDSGWLIPGHGGLFDRLDGLLIAAPAAAALAFALARGVVLPS